jgi:TfoX/Sxy family transcriptional regulator of competence genes
LTIVISEEVNRMDWEKASVELGIELSHLLTGFICQKKPMFGSPVYFINDNMFTGVKGSVVFLRLSESGRKEIMEECDEVRPFEPRPGFFMKEYVEIPESRLFDQDFILKWLQASYQFVSSLPRKEKKAKR